MSIHDSFITQINDHILAKKSYPPRIFTNQVFQFKFGDLDHIMSLSNILYWNWYFVAVETNSLKKPEDYEINSLSTIYRNNKQKVIQQPMNDLTVKRIGQLVSYIFKHNKFPVESSVTLFIENLVYLYQTANNDTTREITKIPFWVEFCTRRVNYIQNNVPLNHRIYNMADLQQFFVDSLRSLPTISSNLISSSAPSITSQPEPECQEVKTEPQDTTMQQPPEPQQEQPEPQQLQPSTELQTTQQQQPLISPVQTHESKLLDFSQQPEEPNKSDNSSSTSSEKRFPVKPKPVKIYEDMFAVGLKNGLITFEIIKKYQEMNIQIPDVYKHIINIKELQYNIENELPFSYDLMIYIMNHKDDPEIKKILAEYKRRLLIDQPLI